MANLQPGEGPSATERADESSETTLQLNIKTLDSQFCSFNVDKNIVVSAFKEKIASQIAVPVEQQRLIFRGKVLNDDQLLSEYKDLENGDTLHLVERQPQPSPGEATSSNGLNANIGDPRNLIGQIAHSVILGTLNTGETGETVIPDLGRAVEAVLNSIGIGNVAGGMQPGFQPLLGNEMEGNHVNAGNQFGSYPTQIPRENAIGLPSFNVPIPESLSTLTEFMNRMESVFSRNDAQENQPTSVLPTNSVGYPTLEALTIVLQHAQRLLRDHAVPALSHAASRLDQEGGSNDPAIRGEVQTESTQLGIALQHLGALFLELGRTVLTLRMGQSSAECFVNSGPSVYISPSGPNPIMVQPFPLQTNSLFGDAAPNPIAVSPASVGNVPRNVNIHIHTAPEPIVPTVGYRAQTGVETQGESDASRHHRSENNQTSAQPTMMDDEKAQSRPTSSSGECPQSRPNTSKHAENLKKSARSDQGTDNPDGSSATPLGLGIGGLQPKKRNRLPRSQSKKTDGASSSNVHSQKTKASGQHVLQSIASLPVQREPNPPSADRAMTRIRSVPPARRNNQDPNIDVSEAMSQVLQSPSLDGLLAGVSQQTGVGSPDMLRSMLQQFTENPAMRNTVNQLAEQIDSHDLGSMFSGLDSRGQGGEIDLSRMMQQMMPIVSQTLGGLSSMSGANPLESSSRREMENNADPQVDAGSSDEIFRSVVERAAYISGDGHEERSLVNALCSERGLAQEFMAMLRHDVSKRLEDGMMF